MAKELKSLLNLNYLDLTNKTHKVGKYDLPSVKCPAIYDIDYIALYKELRNYQKTPKTVISFYQFDKEFDGINGLSNAIWYNDKRRLEFFKRRFSNCRYFIAPDYSQCGDIENAENIHRIFRARVISLWLTLNLGAIVIPNITYSNKKSFEYMLDGLEECQTVAFSTKGIMKKSFEKDLLIAAIAKTVDTLNLKSIIVYTVSIDKETVLKLFAYAINRNIEIIIPDNLLQNVILKGVITYMGKYSHTGLAYGTQGSPQITIDENIYSMKITEISNQLQLNLEQSVKSSSRTFATKKHQHKNIMDKIIFLILSMGYEEIIIGNTIMYIKDNIILKISYIKEYEYYILEKTDTVTNAQNNIFELLASISNEIEPNIMLKTIKNILTKLQ